MVYRIHMHNGQLFVKNEDGKIHPLEGINVEDSRFEEVDTGPNLDIVGTFRINNPLNA